VAFEGRVRLSPRLRIALPEEGFGRFYAKAFKAKPIKLKRLRERVWDADAAAFRGRLNGCLAGKERGEMRNDCRGNSQQGVAFVWVYRAECRRKK
jgi:hypothetical protein